MKLNKRINILIKSNQNQSIKKFESYSKLNKKIKNLKQNSTIITILNKAISNTKTTTNNKKNNLEHLCNPYIKRNNTKIIIYQK